MLLYTVASVLESAQVALVAASLCFVPTQRARMGPCHAG
jgi:hypothetical protein